MGRSATFVQVPAAVIEQGLQDPQALRVRPKTPVEDWKPPDLDSIEDEEMREEMGRLLDNGYVAQTVGQAPIHRWMEEFRHLGSLITDWAEDIGFVLTVSGPGLGDANLYGGKTFNDGDNTYALSPPDHVRAVWSALERVQPDFRRMAREGKNVGGHSRDDDGTESIGSNFDRILDLFRSAVARGNGMIKVYSVQ